MPTPDFIYIQATSRHKEANADMFRDTTHLSRYRGDIAYTDFLVSEYAQAL